MNALSRAVTVAGVVTGVVAAATVGGVTAHRAAVRRLRAGQVPLDADEDIAPIERSYSVVTEDGVPLAVTEVGPVDADLTVVFVHGWALRSDCWQFQRRGLAVDPFGEGTDDDHGARAPGSVPVDTVRFVFYDQRSHGRSGRSATPHPSMDLLAADLAAVLATAVPTGPVVLVGHSMGGIAVLSLVGLQPEYVRARVAGVGLLSTSADERTGGAGGFRLHRTQPVIKVASTVAGRYAGLIERGRASTRDAAWLITRMFGFARRDVPAAVVDHLDDMLSATSVDVIAEFLPGLLAYDRVSALAQLAGIPTLVLSGEADRITPPARSRVLADGLVTAEHVLLPMVGHLPLLEAPEATNDALRRLLGRARDHARDRGVGR